MVSWPAAASIATSISRSNRRGFFVRIDPFAAALALSLLADPAGAATCTNPAALGTARVLQLDPAQYRRVGTVQYPRTLPLAPGEVVLTFDDGPLPSTTGRVLDALAAECVRATFFVVGQMAHANPDWVQRVFDDGHTIATHTQSHRAMFSNLPFETAVSEKKRDRRRVGRARAGPLGRAVLPLPRAAQLAPH
jgi:hypothetical protein